MKNILTISLIILGLSTIKSQQIGLTSQYLFNDFAINPAVAGTKSYSPLSISFRRQWLGIDEAPVTQNLMYHTFLGEVQELEGMFLTMLLVHQETGISTHLLTILRQAKRQNYLLGFQDL